jgi:predicted AlkP superfamily pyrophosphatase or phosphodiesterase
VSVRVLLLVLDGLPARYVGQGRMPALDALARAGGRAGAGRSVLTSSTYPNHATFVTGAAPAVHGLVANHVPTPAGLRPAWQLGPAATTLFDACQAAGRASACVVGDPFLIG